MVYWTIDIQYIYNKFARNVSGIRSRAGARNQRQMRLAEYAFGILHDLSPTGRCFREKVEIIGELNGSVMEV